MLSDSITLQNNRKLERHSYLTKQSCQLVKVTETDGVPGRPSVKKVYIAISHSPLNPPLSLYGNGLLVKPMSWQGHEIQYSVISPLPRIASL